MPNLTGSSSNFSLTGRDSFQKPTQNGSGGKFTRSSIDASLVNKAGDAVIKVQDWAINAIRLNEGITPAFSPTVQRWLVSVTSNGDSKVPITLNLSPSFLEDCAAIPTQTMHPEKARVSLAQSVSSGTPRYIPKGTKGSPPWTNNIQDPKISVRLIGASLHQCISCDPPEFVDLGDGISPALTTSLFFSHPALYGTTLPSGTYEISLLSKAWVD